MMPSAAGYAQPVASQTAGHVVGTPKKAVSCCTKKYIRRYFDDRLTVSKTSDVPLQALQKTATQTDRK
jgi:hypothetical protein